MKRVFICSPYAADTAEERRRNINIARDLCSYALSKGHAPFAPHLLYPQLLDDTLPSARALGIDAGLAFLEVCDEVWVYPANSISLGMLKAIHRAERLVMAIVRIPGGGLKAFMGDTQ